MPMPISQAGTIRAFPNLARAVDVGLAARAGVRLWRSGVASLTTLGRARLSGRRTPRDRAEALARLAGELLDIHGVEVDPIGVLPMQPSEARYCRLSPLLTYSNRHAKAKPLFTKGRQNLDVSQMKQVKLHN